MSKYNEKFKDYYPHKCTNTHAQKQYVQNFKVIFILNIKTI